MRRPILALLLLAACDDPPPPPVEVPVPTAGPAAPPVKKAAAVPTAASAPVVLGYSSVGKRDPFRSYLLDVQQAQVESASARKRQATEEFELDQYKLTGLVTGTSNPVAMVEDPDGVGHALHIGSRIGRNNGRVTRISDRGITIVEEFDDANGQRVRVPISINLPSEQIDTGMRP